MTKSNTTSQEMTELNWMSRTMPLDIFRTLMMKVTKTNTEILVVLICLLITWCGKILTIILSYQTYHITTLVRVVLRKLWRIYFKLLLN